MGRSKLVLCLFNALYSLSLHFVCSVVIRNSYFLSLGERYNREIVVVDPKLQ